MGMPPIDSIEPGDIDPVVLKHLLKGVTRSQSPALPLNHRIARIRYVTGREVFLDRFCSGRDRKKDCIDHHRNS